MNIESIRQKYPQYDSLSDQQLADALYNKFYKSKIDKPDFYGKIGLSEIAKPSFDAKLTDDEALSTMQALQSGSFATSGVDDAKGYLLRQAAIPEIVNPNVESLPEMGFSGLLGGLDLDQSKVAAIAGAALTTPDDKELSDIIIAQVPQIGRTFTREGEVILNNPETGVSVVVNKKGVSRQDVMQALGLGSLFVPAGGLASGAGQLASKAAVGGLASAATQTAIEAGQETLGGEFDTSDIALAGAFGAGGELAAPWLGKVGKAGLEKLKAAPRSVIDKFAAIAKTSNEQGQETVAQLIKKGNIEELAKLADTDPAFFKHLEILGVKSDPLASFAARNPAFRSIAGALEALSPDTVGVKTKFLKELGEKADDIIVKFGGGTDKPAISEAFKTDSLQTIKKLKSESESLYKKFFEIVPRSTKGAAPNTLKVIDDIASDLGGTENLPAALKNLQKNLKDPTYGMIDLKRREVWERKGELDSITGELSNKLYASLTLDSDQLANTAAGEIGDQAINTINAAKALWSKGKVLQDNLNELLGKDLTNSITARLGQQIKQAPEKGFGKLAKTINLLPKDSRQELIMTSLKDVMKGSNLDGAPLNANQYAKWYESLKRSPSTKRLIFDNIPSEAQTALNSLYKASIGVARSNQNVIKTSVAKDMLSSNQGLLRKLMGATAKMSSRATGFIQGEMLESFLKQKSDPAKSAAELMASPKFHALLKEMGRKQIKPKELVKAENALKRTSTYQRWLKSITSEGGTVGGSFVNYLQHTDQELNEDK